MEAESILRIGECLVHLQNKASGVISVEKSDWIQRLYKRRRRVMKYNQHTGGSVVEKKSSWKKGPGKLGVLAPLMGPWQAAADSPMGKVRCTRTFTHVLGGKYVQLVARWEFGAKAYEEFAIYGVKDGTLSFWSFTSDGKRSEGALADGSDVHPLAIAFEADMPAGRARMIYWPDDEGGFHWAVESKTKKGWNRFTQHHYTEL
jgi:hypothetical protein